MKDDLVSSSSRHSPTLTRQMVSRMTSGSYAAEFMLVESAERKITLFFVSQNKISAPEGIKERKHCGTSAKVHAGLLHTGCPTAASSLSSTVEQKTFKMGTLVCHPGRRDQPPTLCPNTELPLPGQPQSRLIYFAPFVSATVYFLLP